VYKIIQELFMGQKEMSQIERNKIKSFPETVAIMQLPGTCKVSAQGVGKIQVQMKK
jgi:hypothetical protein